jgi:hypothetical protein
VKRIEDRGPNKEGVKQGKPLSPLIFIAIRDTAGSVGTEKEI